MIVNFNFSNNIFYFIKLKNLKFKMQNFTDNTDNEDSSYYINRLEKSISDNYIKCYTSKL